MSIKTFPAASLYIVKLPKRMKSTTIIKERKRKKTKHMIGQKFLKTNPTLRSSNRIEIISLSTIEMHAQDIIPAALLAETLLFAPNDHNWGLRMAFANSVSPVVIPADAEV